MLSMPITQRKGLVGNMISVHRVFILTATTLLVMSISHRVDTLEAADMAETSAKEGKMDTTFSYGFRHDPMKFVEGDESLQGALVRTFVFQRSSLRDQKIIQQKVDDILAKQFEDGTLSDNEHHRIQFTAERLIELAELGCDPERPKVKRAMGVLLKEKSDDGDDMLGIYGVRALCMLGMTDLPEVSTGLRYCVEREDEWNGSHKGCPWTPIEHLITLWIGKELYDVEPVVVRALTWIADGLNDAGCLSYKDPWGFVRMSGVIEHQLAATVAEKEVPMILRAQKPDGGWGNESFRVFRMLAKHGLFDRLRSLPPLPPDWRIVRAIPAPDGKLFTMTWDGEKLWVKDGSANEAIAVSSEDGEILNRVKLPVDKVSGIGWWDDALAVTQKEPKRLLKVDPDTGEVKQEISLDKMDEVLGVTQVDGKMIIGDGFMCSSFILNPANPGESRWQTLGGPGPISLATEDDAVWHFDFWAPSIIKSDLSGRLLDWGEKPFNGSVNGLAWDGEHLWALDSKSKRICVIEKY
jgi:hypothetical protein